MNNNTHITKGTQVRAYSHHTGNSCTGTVIIINGPTCTIQDARGFCQKWHMSYLTIIEEK